MAIVKMKRLHLLALAKDHDAMLRQLQHMGCVEISEPDMEQLPDSLHNLFLAKACCLSGHFLCIRSIVINISSTACCLKHQQPSEV